MTDRRLEAILAGFEDYAAGAQNPFWDDVILSDAQLAMMEGVSVKTIQRRRARGDAPPHIQLTDRLHGTRVREWRRWILSRTVK
jgi:hypothetical protein